MSVLGKNIKLLRQKNGWSQEDVASKLDISIPAYSKIETGITDINLSRLYQISALFNVAITQLLDLDQVAEQPASEDASKLVEQLKARDLEVIELQKKIIKLFEEMMDIKDSLRTEPLRG